MARKPGNGGAVLLWLLMFVVLGLGASEFYGPTKGWMRPTISSAKGKASDFQKEYAAKRKRERLAAEAWARDAAHQNPFAILQGDTTAFEDASGDTPEPTPVNPTDPTPSAIVTTSPTFNATKVIEKYPPEQLIPSNNGYAAIFDEIWKGKVAELETPEVGRTYKIRTKDKGIIEGNLLVYSPDRFVLKDDTSNSHSIMANDLSMSSLKRMFPERYSKKFAQYHMAKALRASGIEVPKPEPVSSTPVAIATPKPDIVSGTPDTDPSPTAITKLPRLTKYDPSYAKTPRHLGPPLKEYHAWLDYQNRRLKYRLATKLFAKQHGKSIVLYMEASKSFRMQGREAREVYCDSFWKMWARKLREQGRVGDESDAHLVLIDERGRIIGGSKVQDSSATWVK